MATELNIALIQSALIWEDPKGNREAFDKKLQKMSKGVDLIVLPEMFSTGFTMSPQNIEKVEGLKTLTWMQEQARSKNAALVGSIPFFDNGKYANRLFFVKPDGSYAHYDKRHTFTLAGEDKVYKSGTQRLNVDFRGFRICPLICYDLRFPVWARNTEAYDVLLYVANWPNPRINAWDALLKARAIENMTYCIGVNRVGTDFVGHEYPGHSGAYDMLGAPLAFSKEEEILYACLDKELLTSTRNKLKFLADRDEFNLKL